jgi:hypothetical protein
LYRSNWGRLNAVHVSAALNSLAAFVSAEEENRSRVGDDGGTATNATTSSTATLLDALGRHVRAMPARALSASVWTLAILRPSSAELAPLAPLVAAAVRPHLERGGGFECRDAAIVMWSYATLGPSTSSHLPLGPHLARAFEAYLLAAPARGGMSPRDLSMMLWSAAALHLRGAVRCAGFVRGATHTMASGAMKMEPRQLAQCLWGFAALTAAAASGGGSGERPRQAPDGSGDDGEVGKEGKRDAEDAQGECERAQAGFLRTCAALVALPRFCPAGDESCGGDAGEGRPRGANPQDLSNFLHSFAACRWHPGDDAMRAVAAAVTSASDSFTAEEAADTLWAIATLQPPHDAGVDGAGNGNEGSPREDGAAGGCPRCKCSSGADDVDNKEVAAAADDAAAAAAANLDSTVSDAVAALFTRVAALCAAASPSSSSSSPCCLTFDAQATSNALWAAAVLGRCARPEAAPLWRVARAKIQLCLTGEARGVDQVRVRPEEGAEGTHGGGDGGGDGDGGGGEGGFSEAGLVQLFYASWCFLEERGGDDDDEVVEAAAGFAGESLRESVGRIHEYAAEVVSRRRGRVSAKTSKLQLSVGAAAAEVRGADGGLGVQAVEVEAEVVIGRSVSVATTVDLLLTMMRASPGDDGETTEKSSSMSFIVEVDGPTHFTRGAGGRGGGGGSDGARAVGGTALRNRLMRGGCAGGRGRGHDSRIAGFVALPYYALDDASRLAGRAGIAEVLRDALVRAGARL